MTAADAGDQERRKELADFLRTRRARLLPGQVGLPIGARRRTPGLRREEVAHLIGVGTTWYTWLEQGRDIRVSADVLENVARVLRLDGDERAHLFALARRPLPTPQSPLAERVRPALRQLLAALDPFPAHIRNTRWDVLAWNRAEALIAEWGALSDGERNAVWNHFTNPVVRDRLVDWEGDAHKLLALYRMENGYRLGDARFADLVQRLQITSPEFSAWWPQHQVQQHREEPMEFAHPQVGRFSLERVVLRIEQDPPLTLRVMVPVPGTDAAAKLRVLMGTG